MPHSKPQAAKPAAKAEAKAARSKPAVKAGEAAPPKESRSEGARPKSDLAAKVLRLIAEEMAIEEAELTPNASFKEDLNLDEIDVAELLMQAEQSLHATPFNEDDWESCETVGDFVSLVESHYTGGKSRTPRRA